MLDDESASADFVPSEYTNLFSPRSKATIVLFVVELYPEQANSPVILPADVPSAVDNPPMIYNLTVTYDVDALFAIGEITVI